MDIMLFNLLRIVLWLIISSFVVLKIRKTKIVRKKLVSLLIVVLCLGLISVSGMFPIENLFINFKSPESVFNYTNSGKVNDVLYGKESCMAIYSNWNSTGGHYIIPKTEKGYKIPSCFATKIVSHKFDKSGLFDVYNVKGTQDYYVFGTVHLKDDGNEIDIFDGSDEKVESNIIRVGHTNFIYFFLDDFSNEYYLLINGEKVSISK
jgi:hypothetical protein